MRSVPLLLKLPAALAGLVLCASCSSLRLDPSTSVRPGDWPTEGETVFRTNATDFDLSPPLEEQWTFNAGGGFADVSPLIVDRHVIVGTRKGEIHAIALDSGRRVGTGEFGESIEGTPVFHDGVLFVPVGWGRRALVAYDVRRGGRKWSIRGAPITAGLLAHGSSVIAAHEDGVVRAYDKLTGAVQWDIPLGERVGVHSTPAIAGEGLLVVADDEGTVTAISVDQGLVQWRSDLPAPVYASLAADSASIFIPTTRGRLFKLDATNGEILWEFDAGEPNAYLAASALDGGDLVFGASDGLVRCLDAETGELRWTAEPGGAITAPPLITRSSVFVGTMRNKVHGLDRQSGKANWSTELKGRVKSAFAAKGNRLVVLAEPQTVYMFESAEEGYVLAD